MIPHFRPIIRQTSGGSINYILNQNDPGLTPDDVQIAIWNVLEGYPNDGSPTAQILADAAILNSGFVPTGTQKRGVILDLGPNSLVQPIIIEVTCGGPPPPPSDLCAQEAVGNTNINNNATYAFALGGMLGNDFITGPQPLKLLQQTNGSALLTGVVVRASNPNLCFTVNITFSGPTSTAPAGYPQKLIAPADSSSWTYFTSVSGTLVGQKGLAGTNIFVAAPGAQFGFVANNNNLLNGYFSSITWGTTLGTVTNAGVLAGQIVECPDVDDVCLDQALRCN